MNCCICGPVKNCGPYLRKVFDNIEKIGSLFDDYKILIFYDKSNDNTLDILKEYQLKNEIPKFPVPRKEITNAKEFRQALEDINTRLK